MRADRFHETGRSAAARTLEAHPDAVIEDVARGHGLTALEATRCLPAPLWSEIPGAHFERVLREVSDWGEVTVIVHNQDLILEVRGRLPPGRHARGFYNLRAEGAIAGHLRPERCSTILLVRRPFMGCDTASVQFFNTDGEGMLKIFLGRDEQGRLRPDQMRRFRVLAEELGGGSGSLSA